YYAVACDVSRRMIGGETGEDLVEAMAVMQTRQMHAVESLKRATAFDRGELTSIFAAAAVSQQTAGRLRLGVGVACLAFVTLLSLWLSRGVLESVGELTSGFARFGRGEFATPIRVKNRDELEEVAERANLMAESLRRVGTERERN